LFDILFYKAADVFGNRKKTKGKKWGRGKREEKLERFFRGGKSIAIYIKNENRTKMTIPNRN